MRSATISACRTTTWKRSRKQPNDDGPGPVPQKLKTAWNRETASAWQPENPAKGQCSVSALVAQDVLGGDILKTHTPGGAHFYNRVDGIKWDFTISQFDQPIPFEDLPSNRDEAMADTSLAQYEALRNNLGL